MDGLIILDASGRPIIQSNFRNHPPNYPLAVVDAFNDAVSKSRTEDSAHEDLDPVLYISTTTTPCVCCHVQAGGLRFLCPASQEMDPLYMFAFLERFITILQEYLQEISLPTLKEHFDVVYQLLEEMLDDGRPLTTEANTLRDIVLPPSFFNKILSVAGVSGLSTSAPTPFSSPIPWRKSGVKYAKNEIYFDIAEELDAIIARNGTLLTSNIWGKINCNSQLSGTPDLLLSFTNAKAFADPSFHSCVRLQKFAQTSALSFVPPDGNFVLMEYRVSPTALTATKTLATSNVTQNQLNYIPFILKPSIEIGEKGGAFTFTLSPRPNTQLKHQAIEQVVTWFDLGDGATVAHCSLSFNPGGGGMRDRDKEERMVGTWAWEPKEKLVRWTIPTFPAASTSATWTLKGTFTSTETTPRPSRSIMTSFRAPHMLFSGLKVDQLKLSGEMYKPFKGVRITGSATVEWRW